jgi:hypothetical protein
MLYCTSCTKLASEQSESKQTDRLDQDMQQGIELDKFELKKYVSFVINEVKKKDTV